MIEIRHKLDGRVLYAAEDARDVRAAVEGARREGVNLWGVNLRGADLWCANLRNVNLWGVNLQGADLRCANLQGANLQGANLRGADLWGADLRNVNLRDVNLRGVNLRGAKGSPLAVQGLPSGDALVHYADSMWQIRVGRWIGTPDELDEMVRGDEGWPESAGEQIVARRPALLALVELARAHIEAQGEPGKEADHE